jgi:hypothetical protein
MAIAQGRHGYVSIGGTLYPVYSWRMDRPRNLQAPLPVGNTWTTNFAEGLQSTRFVAEMKVREKASEILAAAWWNRFLSRPFAGGFDDTATQTVIASNGKRLHTLANAKAEAFVLRIQPGMPIGLQAVFVAPGLPSHSAHVPTDYTNTIDDSPPLMADKASFGGISGGIFGAEITYANNHLPDARLVGTKTLSAWDAGVISCGAALTFDARTAAEYPFADGATLTIALVGAATRTLSLTRVIPNNPDDAGSGTGQNFVTYNCLVQGTATTPPLVVT